jgi:hypothetical protein
MGAGRPLTSFASSSITRWFSRQASRWKRGYGADLSNECRFVEEVCRVNEDAKAGSIYITCSKSK